MIKYVLIFLISISQSLTLSGPSGNYQDLQTFLQSFMNTYTGSTYQMSTCLTPQIQATLDKNLANSYGYLLTLDFSGLLQSYETFLYNLVISCELCGLNQVQVSLNEGLNEKGQFWYQVNFLFHSQQVKSLFEKFGKKYSAQDWAGAGAALGQITLILVPFEQQALSMNFEAFDQNVYQTWWKGFVNGLSANNRKLGPCAGFLLKFANSTIPAANDFSKINSKDMSGFNTIFGNMADSLTFGKTNYMNNCNFELLKENTRSAMSVEGVKELLLRFLGNIAYCNSAVQKIQSCNENIFGCGQGYGTLIKYLLAWPIN
jgi:hypothetical protein